MKNKKIAVFSTGWSGEILHQYLNGLREGLEDQSADVYLFLSHAVYGISEAMLRGELNIYKLPDMREFDAALLFANSLDFPNVIDNITNRCIEANIPIIYTGRDDERFYFAGSDNTVGTRELGRHLIEKHNVKKIWFMAGTPENMDSNMRLNAIREVMAENNLELKDEDICYTNWSPYLGFMFVREQLAKGKGRPDAIVCANDTLAMVICNDLEKNGYRVPEDIIVTGFDNEMMAQLYDPSICSVDQRFDNIGRSCADILVDVFAGKETARVRKTNCEFVPSESCGCKQAKNFEAIRRKIGKDKFDEKINNSNFDIKLTTMERIILQGNDMVSLSDAFVNLNNNDVQYEGNTFQIFIDPLVERSITENQRELRKEGYPEVMSMIYSKDRGVVRTLADFDTKDVVEQFHNSGNRFYIIMPLHDDDYEIGYCVMGDDYQKISDAQMLRKYMERLNIILNRYFQKLRLNALNQRLLQMTETDAMTHVKNRTAFETRLGELQAKMCSEIKPQYAIALFDINNLKTINDSLGHEAGDEYIINSCRMICKTFKKSAVYRIGGDEFVAVLERDDYKRRDALLKEMREEMKLLEEEKDIPVFEKISIASGVAVYDSEKDFNVQEVFNRADSAMYENKAAMKAAAK